MAVQGRRVVLVVGGGAAVAAGVPLAAGGTAEAANFEVTNLNDDGAGSLRQAILDANAALGADTITFASGLTGTITLTSGQLLIADDVTITGPGAAVITVSGNDASRVFYVGNVATNIDVTISGVTVTDGSADRGAGVRNLDENLTLDDVVVTGNTASAEGGGVWADGFYMGLTITDTVISGNAALTGGGIYVEDTGAPVTITGSTISGNSAIERGGGIYFYDPDDSITITTTTISGNSAGGSGGGIYLYDTDGGPFVIDSSTISGNSSGRSGGGIYLYGPDDPITIVNTTISGNTAVSSGGGFEARYLTDATEIAHSTIVGNTASFGGGGVTVNSGDFTLDHTIVADNVAPASLDVDGGATFTADFSLIESAIVSIGGANNLTGVDPQLAALANNGGPTQTHLPAAGSAAINAGDPAFAAPPATDQRGLARVSGGRIDIGSVEVAPQPPVNDAYSTPEDTPLTVAAPGVLANDPFTGTPTLATGPTNGTLVLNADGSFTYTPTADFNGADSFTYTIAGAGTATVSLTVTPVDEPVVNRPPVVVADTATVGPGRAVTIPVLANDSDPDGQPLSISAVTQGTKGTVVISGTSIVYTANAGAIGPDTFTYTVTDGQASVTGTVTVTVSGRIPDTGGGDLPLALGGLVLVLSGAVLTGVGRRRPQPG